MQLFTATKKSNISGSNEAGVTLIETLIALALLGVIAAAFLGGLATAAQATFIADERATAESLARSQIEYVKNQTYIDYSADPHDVYDEITPPSGSGYSIDFTAVPIDPDTGQNQGIQKIRVTVYHGDKLVLTVDGYKVDRYEAE